MFYKLFNNININFKKNKKYFKINLKKNEKNIVIILLKLNIIKFIKIYNKTHYIKLNILKNNKLLFNLKNMYRVSNINYINKKI